MILKSNSPLTGTVSVKTIGLGLFAIVVVAAITLVILKSSGVTVEESDVSFNANPLLVQQNSGQELIRNETLAQEIPAEVRSYVGTIVSVNEQSFTIDARKDVNERKAYF